jgi:hypothetical protein
VHRHLDNAARALEALAGAEADIAARICIDYGVAEQVPDQGASADLIWCRDVLEHGTGLSSPAAPVGLPVAALACPIQALSRPHLYSPNSKIMIFELSCEYMPIIGGTGAHNDDNAHFRNLAVTGVAGGTRPRVPPVPSVKAPEKPFRVHSRPRPAIPVL